MTHSTYAIESTTSILTRRMRMRIRNFKTSDAMYKFLNKGDTALHWKVSDRGLKSGTYVFCGGEWHNVKGLDPSILAYV